MNVWLYPVVTRLILKECDVLLCGICGVSWIKTFEFFCVLFPSYPNSFFPHPSNSVQFAFKKIVWKDFPSIIIELGGDGISLCWYVKKKINIDNNSMMKNSIK